MVPFMPKNMIEPDKPQITIWRLACWISNATLVHVHARARTRTPAYPHASTHTQALTHLRARAQTHRNV
jgi:hypothetical protein